MGRVRQLEGVLELEQRLLLHIGRLPESVLPEKQQLSVRKKIADKQVLQRQQHGHALASALLGCHGQQLVEVGCAVHGALLHQQSQRSNAVAHSALRCSSNVTPCGSTRAHASAWVVRGAGTFFSTSASHLKSVVEPCTPCFARFAWCSSAAAAAACLWLTCSGNRFLAGGERTREASGSWYLRGAVVGNNKKQYGDDV